MTKRQKPPVLDTADAEAYKELKAEADKARARRRVNVRRAVEDHQAARERRDLSRKHSTQLAVET